MEKLTLTEEEIKEVVVITGLVTLPETATVSSTVIGCKGCEGGCATALGR